MRIYKNCNNHSNLLDDSVLPLLLDLSQPPFPRNQQTLVQVLANGCQFLLSWSEIHHEPSVAVKFIALQLQKHFEMVTLKSCLPIRSMLNHTCRHFKLGFSQKDAIYRFSFQFRSQVKLFLY